MKSRVFFVQEMVRSNGDRVHDLSDATRFGRLVFLWAAGHPTYDMAPIVDQMRSTLADFSDNDWLAASGHPILIGIAASFAAAANNGRVRWLRWHNVKKRYDPQSVSLGEPFEKLDTSQLVE